MAVQGHNPWIYPLQVKYCSFQAAANGTHARLLEEDRFAAGRSPFGLPKVRVQKAIAGKKKKKTVEEGAAAPAAAAKGKK